MGYDVWLVGIGFFGKEFKVEAKLYRIGDLLYSLLFRLYSTELGRILAEKGILSWK